MSPFAEAKQQLVDAARRLSERGFLVATGGNLSIRVRGRGAFAVTPSNLDYHRMTPEDVCVLGERRLEVIEGARKPSIESSLHAAVYRARADVNAIAHTHQAHACALAAIDTPIPPLFDEQVRFLGRSVEVVPYGPSGSWLLRRNVERRLRSHANAYLLRSHGALCLGTDLDRAEGNAEILEKCAIAYLLALCAERPARRIPLYARELVFNALRADQRRSEAELERRARRAS